MKWELDLWYELWERAGSQGLDTWHDLGDEVRDARGSKPDDGTEMPGNGSPEGV